MSEKLAPPTAAAVLLVALEPSAPRGRIEAALVLLGHPTDALGEATTCGLVRISDERLEVVDVRVARLVSQTATDRERRLAHLALACSRARRTIGYDARSVFDALSGALDGSVPLPLPPESESRMPRISGIRSHRASRRWPSSRRADYRPARSRPRRT